MYFPTLPIISNSAATWLYFCEIFSLNWNALGWMTACGSVIFGGGGEFGVFLAKTVYLFAKTNLWTNMLPRSCLKHCKCLKHTCSKKNSYNILSNLQPHDLEEGLGQSVGLCTKVLLHSPMKICTCSEKTTLFLSDKFPKDSICIEYASTWIQIALS